MIMGMKQIKIYMLMALAFVSLTARSQIRYEQWIDNNRASAVYGTLILGEQNISVDISAIPWAGLHFLNILPYDESGEPGVWKCIPFMMPEAWTGTTDAVTMEYWVTGYDDVPKRLKYSGPAVSLNIDISKMSYGLHFLNFRTFNEKGEPGAWKQILFYISNFLFDRETVSYQYWIDNGEKHNATTSSPGVEPFTVSIDGLSVGKHTFYYRLCNSGDPTAEDAVFGETVAVPFEIKSTAIKGDVNHDGKVNVGDIMAVINIMAAGGNNMDGDVNEDKKVNVGDIMAIINIMANQ